MEALGIKRGDYVIKVNNRKVLDGVMEAIGLGGEENAGRRLTVLRAHRQVRSAWAARAFARCSAMGRKDESGDFTKGAGLDKEQQHEIMTWLGSSAQLVELASLSDKQSGRGG